MKKYKAPFYGRTDSLINLCESITDCHHSTPIYLDEGKLVIRNFNIKNGRILLENLSYTSEEHFNQRISRAKPESGDLIITREAPMGEVCIIPDGLECCLGQRLVLIKPDFDKVDNRYLLYAILSEYTQIQIGKNDNTGSIVSNLRIPVLKELLIPSIPLSMQRKVGRILGNIDTKIELNHKIKQELEAIAKTLYDYWFIQFDFPNKQGNPYKSSGGKMIYNEILKKEIPEGWAVRELGNLIDIQRGISYKSSEIVGEGIPMINLNSFNLDGTYKASGIKLFSGKFAEKHQAKSGDLLIAATDVTRNADIIGKAILVPQSYKNDLVYSMDIAKVIPKEQISSSYLMMLFNSNHYHNYIKWYATGTIVLHLNMDGIRWYKAEIPPYHLISRFDSFYLPIANRINETQIQNQQLKELRDWLLPMLMNGQVTVGEVKEELDIAAEQSEKYGA